MEQLNQFLDELEKDEGIKVQIEETSKQLGEILASGCARGSGGRCASCANSGGREFLDSLDENEKVAA